MSKRRSGLSSSLLTKVGIMGWPPPCNSERDDGIKWLTDEQHFQSPFVFIPISCHAKINDYLSYVRSRIEFYSAFKYGNAFSYEKCFCNIYCLCVAFNLIETPNEILSNIWFWTINLGTALVFSDSAKDTSLRRTHSRVV